MRENSVVARCALALLSSVLAAGASHAQCSYASTLLGSFERMDPSTPDGSQNALNAWTFHRSDLNEALLQGIDNGAPAWGSLDQAYHVPLVGPRYSPDPNRNQIAFYHRVPSFEGVMMHPGVDAIECIAEFSPQADVTLTGLTIHAEDLGIASPNVLIRAEVRTAEGTTVLIPSTSVNSLADALTLTPASGLPITLGPTAVLRVISNNGGLPYEDWLNAQAVLTLAGVPAIIRQPDSVTTTAFNDAQLSVDADGATGWKWYRGTEPLSDGPGPAGSTISGSGSSTLTIHGAQPDNAGRYHAVVSNSCGQVASAEVALVVCAADFNADGFVDIFDFNDFVTCFEGGDCPPGKSADFNNDGFPDVFDFTDFVTAFEFGC